MLSGHEIHRINNVAARIFIPSGEAFFYHPDCLPDSGITEEDVSIDHPYFGGEGQFTRYDDICKGCREELGESGGVQPEDEDNERLDDNLDV